MKVSGHANYSEHGLDIVCSAVSMLCFCIANTCHDYADNIKCNITDDYFEFSLLISCTESNVLFKTLYEGMLMLRDEYPKYVQIKEV
jgi:uncharacterized protein YsxB (DUF464 family)